MNIEEFRTTLKEMEPVLQAWGGRVVSEISRSLDRELGERFPSFLKLPANYRIKAESSALGKIARKGYTDPIRQMTDLVGVRFVVLLRTDIDIIAKIIEGATLWTASRDRDYEAEIEKAPSHFDYQSVHYVIRANTDMDCHGIIVPGDTPCEIQIRTLLQHAYAEMVHDNIYKPTGEVPSKAKRYVARSMALMETTDDLFCQTMSMLQEANAVRNVWFDRLKALYINTIGKDQLEIDDMLNLTLLDTYRDILEGIDPSGVEKFISDRVFISERVRQRANTQFLYKQPAILLIYLLVKQEDYETKRRWPFGSLRDELGQVYSDLGTSIGDNTL
jgi:putative GTP pyrophosphokinase